MKPLILESGRNRLILTDLPDGLSLKMEFDGAGLAMIERDPERIMAICRASFAAYRRVKKHHAAEILPQPEPGRE